MPVTRENDLLETRTVSRPAGGSASPDALSPNVLNPTALSPDALVHPLDIGGVALATNLILAPMSGVTDSAFRRMVKRCSAGSVALLVSEFVASEGLVRDNAKTLAMMRYTPCERPLSIQIFGADPAHMAAAARMVERSGADIVDVNCGCPVPKVVKRGGGAELMRQPQLLQKILREIRRSVSIPLTVKIRAGWDERNLNAIDIALIAEDCGAAMVAVHGRTRTQLYSGEADWDTVAAVRERLAIVVAGSGDVGAPDDAVERLRGGYADALMIGRAAIADPWIFARIEAKSRGVVFRDVSSGEKVEALRRLREDLLCALPERAVIGRFRGLSCRMIKGLPGSAAIRKAIGEAADSSKVQDIVAAFLSSTRADADEDGAGVPASPHYS